MIAKGDMIWYNLCEECHNEIKTLTSKIQTIEKTSIKIDDQHTYIIGKNGPVIKCTNGDQITFKSVKPDINLDDLKKGTIGLEDVLSDVQRDAKLLGEYQGERLILKKGKFGYYLSWGDNKKSIPSTDFDESNFTIENAVSIIETKDANMIRKIDDNSSVRNGKYGPCLLYTSPSPRDPE